jgi:phage terminase Nu1 subunit (DNA packaging protein)
VKKKPARTVARKKSDRKKSSGAPEWIGKIRHVGELLNLSERRIFQLQHEGLPRVSPGVYDLVVVARWYVRFLQRKIAERANPPADSPTAAGAVMRHRLLSIESELAQIELAKKREQLISVEKVRKDIAAIVREIRRIFGELPKKIAAEVVGVTDLAVSQVLIDRTLKSALEKLSEFDPEEAVTPASPARSSTRSRTQ